MFSSSVIPATQAGPYARLNSGYSFGNSGVGESWLIGGGLGWRFNPNLRADLTFDYRPDFDQNTNFGIGPGPRTGLQNWTAMANGYYDFNLPRINPLVPYVGAGIGIAQNSVDGVTVRTSPTTTSHLTGSERNQFAWQAMAGVAYYFTPTLALDVGYRYLDAGNSGYGTSLHANEVTAAIRVGF
jgi:opacity protein-like surface antigen